jgi:hypothetical protein
MLIHPLGTKYHFSTQFPSVQKYAAMQRSKNLMTVEICSVTRESNRTYGQNYWVFGLFPSSSILENRKHNISETGSLSVLS